MLKQKLILLVFAILRTIAPIIKFGNKYFVFCYDDVTEVLQRNTDFTIKEINQPKIDKYTGPFILGMDKSDQEARESSILQKAVKRDDIELIQTIVRDASRELVEKARPKGRIDMVSELSLVVPCHFLDKYCGTPGPDLQTMQRWMRSIFYNVFLNFKNTPTQVKEAEQASSELKIYLENLILEKQKTIKEGIYTKDDFLSRLIRMQDNPETYLDNDGIRRNISGVILGAVDTISKSSVHIIEQLLSRPDILKGAAKAAQNNDFDLVSRYTFEAMRFNPFNPILIRYIEKDTTLGTHTLKGGNQIYSVAWSAMFDSKAFPDPNTFRLDRVYETYILFGWGMHRCFGEYVNRIELPEICMALLKLPNLRRVKGSEGTITYDTTDTFPDRYVLEFDK